MTHIPDMDSATSSAEDNPFAATKQQPVGKIRSSETRGLHRDQFVKPA